MIGTKQMIVLTVQAENVRSPFRFLIVFLIKWKTEATDGRQFNGNGTASANRLLHLCGCRDSASAVTCADDRTAIPGACTNDHFDR